LSFSSSTIPSFNHTETDFHLTESVHQHLSPDLVQQFGNLTETTSRNLAQRLTIVPVAMGSGTVATATVCGGYHSPAVAPLVCLHGFDSSLLEFRRLLPALEQRLSAAQLNSENQVNNSQPELDSTAKVGNIWLLDLLGFGFTERPLDLAITPETIKTHLYQFWQTYCQQPMVLVGASMGGAAAIDFALTYPHAVSQLILIDSAGLAGGSPVGKWLFPPLDRWATQFLASAGVRRQVSLKAYLDPKLVTADAELCAALHLQMPHWSEGLISFTKSGGYGSYGTALGAAIKSLTMATLILWGRNDQILGTKDAAKFRNLIPNSQLQWIPASGHVPHLERPDLTAQAIVDFWLDRN